MRLSFVAFELVLRCFLMTSLLFRLTYNRHFGLVYDVVMS